MSEAQAHRLRDPTVTLAVGLRLVEEAVIDLTRVPEVLGSAEAPWLGERIASDDRSMRRFLCDLLLNAGDGGPTLFRKAAIVSFGEPRHETGAWIVAIEWRAATMSALFPVLVGQLRVEPARVELDGRYAPPGGGLGHLLDAALLGTAARQTGRWFLRRVVAALS